MFEVDGVLVGGNPLNGDHICKGWSHDGRSRRVRSGEREGGHQENRMTVEELEDMRKRDEGASASAGSEMSRRSMYWKYQQLVFVFEKRKWLSE